MKIYIKELGAVKEGTIDLSKKLNVFCGPNGTGKTYMAYVIYGLLKSQIHIGTNEVLAKELIEKRTAKYIISFDALNKYRKDIIDNFKEDFDSLFGIGEDLAKQYFENTEIAFKETNEEFKQQIIDSKFQTTISIRKIDIEVSKTNGTDFLVLGIQEKVISNKDIDTLNFFLFSSILSLLATHPIGSTYILPVERNSIFTFNKELSISKQEAVDHFHAMTGKNKLDRFDLLFKKTTRYPLPIKDGLMIADDLAEIKKSTSKFFDFASEIENELLHGKVLITSEGEIQFKSDKAPKRVLPIHMTASIIKSLSSLVVYLKHIAQKNDLIIIDEPEINLHPDNQIILTKLFARLINKGFRLLISTHSDYVVRELNNLIMLSSDKLEIEELKKLYSYTNEEFIKKEDIAVHYFNYPHKQRGNKQVTIESLEIDESGFEIPSVDVTIEQQNKIAEELFYTLKYGKINE
jgi:predicted ATPase